MGLICLQDLLFLMIECRLNVSFAAASPGAFQSVSMCVRGAFAVVSMAAAMLQPVCVG